MIAIDSSVWIDFFRDRSTRQVERLVRAVRSEDVLVPDLVLAEVLQGCDTDREFRAVRRELAPYRLVATVDEHIAVAAAGNFRRLRSLGITVRKTIDTLIATRCILDDIPLLYSDRDFDPFVEHLGLRTALDSDTGVT